MTSGWQDSRSANPRHEHTPVADSSGRNICSSCSKIVVVPIIDSNDPRLEGAGLERSDGRIEVRQVPWTLPEVLMHYHMETEGDFPYAPYVGLLIGEHNRRGTCDDDLFERLYNKL